MSNAYDVDLSATKREKAWNVRRKKQQQHLNGNKGFTLIFITAKSKCGKLFKYFIAFERLNALEIYIDIHMYTIYYTYTRVCLCACAQTAA